MRVLKYKKTDRAKAKGQKRHAQNSERVKLHVTTGDTVKVMRGDDKGHVGKVVRVYRKTGRVVGEGANFAKRHRQARTAEERSSCSPTVGRAARRSRGESSRSRRRSMRPT